MRIGDRTFESLRLAGRALIAGDTLDIGPGVYREPLVIEADRIRVRGHGRVVLERAAAEGKALIVVRGRDVRLQNLECRRVSVPSGNGACVRAEGRNLDIDQLYIHHTQMGLLTGPRPGYVRIRDSRFEATDSDRQWAHGVYVGGGRLLAEDSAFLSARHEGHEVKSRAAETVIRRCVIASLNARDSRLIDIPNGGSLFVEDSLLVQGPSSSNQDAIGIGLEQRRYPRDEVTLLRNRILLERDGASQLLHARDPHTRVEVRDNLIVSRSRTGFERTNRVFRTRHAAGLPESPRLIMLQMTP